MPRAAAPTHVAATPPGAAVATPPSATPASPTRAAATSAALPAPPPGAAGTPTAETAHVAQTPNGAATAPATTSPAAAHPVTLTLMRGALRVLSATAPKIASRVAADLFMTPRRFPTPPREREILALGNPFRVPLGGASEVHAWRFGADSGPLVILAHGWEGRGSQLTPFVAPLVERGFRVVAFDAPGHGASPGSRSSLPHFAWAIRAVADATGQPHAIIAHSLGCAAATLALRDGLAVRRLAFLAPPLNPVDYTARFGDILGLDAATLQAMRTRIEERFARKWSDYSLAETARTMTTPLLVVHDREDRDTYWSEGAALADAWPGARLVTTEGLGHRRILREPAVIDDVARFVSVMV